jgi:O-antigen/teichoic acid export membrane protein
MAIKRALALTFAERYSAVIVNMIMVAVVARLLTPAQIGVAAIGASVIGVVECLRDFGTGSFIVQARELTREHARSSFTVLALASGAVGVAMFLGSNGIATIYGDHELASFLRITAFAFFAAPVSSPLMAFMRREMDFRSLAIVNSVSTIANAIIIIVLAAEGFGVLSFAWATVAQYVISAVVAISLRPHIWMFKPNFRYWKEPFSFGVYSSVSDMLGRLQDMATYFILGRNYQAEAVGLYSRATLICFLPIKVIAVGVVPVAFPALAAHARDGRDLKEMYLRATSYITAVQWPGLLLIAIFAHTIVAIYLGHQWLSVVPLVRILAIAGIVTSMLGMNSPLLMAFGAVRRLTLLSMANVLLSIASVLVCAKFGLVAIAFGQLLIAPVQGVVSFYAIQKFAPLKWLELFGSLRASAIVTICSVIGPAFVAMMSGPDHILSIEAICVVGILACSGWIISLWLVQHPIFAEIRAALVGRFLWRRNGKRDL